MSARNRKGITEITMHYNEIASIDRDPERPAYFRALDKNGDVVFMVRDDDIFDGDGMMFYDDLND